MVTAHTLRQSSAWETAGASVRGISHVREGLPNQDAIARSGSAGSSPLPAIVAIADGHGSLRHFRSATGARLAVEVTLATLSSIASRLSKASSSERSHIAAVEVPTRIVETWTAAVRDHLSEHPIGEHEWAAVERAEGAATVAGLRADPLLAYGATLLAAMVTAECILLTQLGDGDILCVAEDGSTTRPVPTDERLVGNRTTSICMAGAESDFRSVLLTSAPSLLLLSTDGYANSFKTDSDFLKVGSDLLGMVRRDGIAAVEHELPAILEHASTNGSGDDITVGLMHPLERDTGKGTGVSDAVPTGSAAGRGQTTAAAEESLALAQRRISRLKQGLGVAVAVAVLAVAWSLRDHLPSTASPVVPDKAATGAGKDPGAKVVEAVGLKGSEGKDTKAAVPSTASVELLQVAYVEVGVEITAVVQPGDAAVDGCKLTATVWDGKDRRLESAESALTPTPMQTVRMVVAYPLDDKGVKSMKSKDSKASMVLTCEGQTMAESKKQRIGARTLHPSQAGTEAGTATERTAGVSDEGPAVEPNAPDKKRRSPANDPVVEKSAAAKGKTGASPRTGNP